MRTTYLKIQILSDILLVMIAFIVGVSFAIEGWMLFSITLIPLLLKQLIFYSWLRKQVLNRSVEEFGITSTRMLFGALTAFTIGGAILVGLIYFEPAYFSRENAVNWIWIAILVSRMIESLVPYSYWKVVATDKQLIVKKAIGVREIILQPAMTVSVITSDKIELISGASCWELPIREEELKQFMTIVAKTG